MISLFKSFRARRSFAAALLLGCCQIGWGCRNRESHDNLHLSRVEDADSLIQLKALSSFKASLVDLFILEGSDASSSNVPAHAMAVTNSYQFVLRVERGNEIVFAGNNASAQDLIILRSLDKTNFYTFPDVLRKH